MSNDNRMNYSGEEPYYNQMPQDPNYQVPQTPGYQAPQFTTQSFETNPGKLDVKKPRNIWKMATLVMSIVALIAILLAVFAFNLPRTTAQKVVATTPVATSITQQPTTAATSVTQQPTAGATGTATAQPAAGNDYSAIQPGPGCDTNGGTWTPQGIDNITCGTQIAVNAPNSRGYLYFQLPNNKAFSANNTIGVTTALAGYADSVGNCTGLAEEDANTGFLVEYCNDGRWFIHSISSGGAIIQTLGKNVTSVKTPDEISLTLKGTTLSLSRDTEVLDTVTIAPIHPIKVAITYSTGPGGESVTISNFSYTV